MKPPRPLRTDGRAVSPVVATILMVAITIVLVAVLYALVVGVLPGRTGGVEAFGLVVTTSGTNWTVTFASVPPGKLPSSTYLLIRNSSFALVLPRIPFANLTEARWPTNHALYLDGSPTSSEITSSDHLLIDRFEYPSGSTLEISDEYRLLGTHPL